MEEKENRLMPIVPMLVSALLITLFLFYVDEGYYSFAWMESWGNWFVFFIYVALIFTIQSTLFFLYRAGKFLFKKMGL